MLYIDVCNFDDYDTLVRFLLGKNVTIVERKKSEMMVAAEVPESLVPELLGLELKEAITMGTDRLM